MNLSPWQEKNAHLDKDDEKQGYLDNEDGFQVLRVFPLLCHLALNGKESHLGLGCSRCI
jgi:hypothetical protein